MKRPSLLFNVFLRKEKYSNKTSSCQNNKRIQSLNICAHPNISKANSCDRVLLILAVEWPEWQSGHTRGGILRQTT